MVVSRVQVCSVRSFVSGMTGGNHAGVCLNLNSAMPALTEKQMQHIAADVGYSETAFVSRSTCADFNLRFFTPTKEVDLCGHATIAAFHVLMQMGFLVPGPYNQETLSGILGVELRSDGSVFMEQTLPQFFDEVPWERLAPLFGGVVGGYDLPARIVSTGLKDIMMPVQSLWALRRLNPDFDRIAELSRSLDVTGVHAFTLETLHGSTAHCRNFGPAVGIPEESATGTSNGALSAYLYRMGKLSSETLGRLSFEQGYFMQDPALVSSSTIMASLNVTGREITRVMVGGKAEIDDDQMVSF